MRSRIFRTTVHLIAAYLVCWLPYNGMCHFLYSLISRSIVMIAYSARACHILRQRPADPHFSAFGAVAPLRATECPPQPVHLRYEHVDQRLKGKMIKD